MAKTDFKTIDEYLATVTPEARKALEEVRKCIHSAVPGAEEGISYQLPVIRSNGVILYFSAYTRHYSISSPPPTFEQFKEDLKDFKVSKSAWQVPYDQPVPVKLIAKIAKHRAEENARAVDEN